MGNRGNQGWHMGKRVGPGYKVCNGMGRGGQKWGFESQVWMATVRRLWYGRTSDRAGRGNNS